MILLAVLGWAVLSVDAAEPPAAPILRLEVGAHGTKITEAATDAAGRFLVTGSEDKTVRVWDCVDGHLLQVLRPPIAPGIEGNVYGVAMSPDGSTIACAGVMGEKGSDAIYIFDRVSGGVVRCIRGPWSTVTHLAWSPDGQFLAAVLASHGLRVFSVDTGTLTAEDTDYGDWCGGVGFDRDGRLVTSCDDGFVRLYSAQFRLAAKRRVTIGKAPATARFAPDGNRVAVGFEGTCRIAVLSGADLSVLYEPSTVGVEGYNLSHVAWSSDGRFLFAGGRSAGSQILFNIRKWEDGGRGRYMHLSYTEHPEQAV